MKFVIVSLLTLTLAFTMSVALAVPSLPSGPPSPSKIEGYCGEQGGTYWPPGPESSTYGCILPDGSVVACGGIIKGCSTIDAAVGLPPYKLPLSVIDLKLGIQTQTKQDEMNSKLDLLELMIDDLSILVEDACEPPIFVP
jgi:hypothetical protein